MTRALPAKVKTGRRPKRIPADAARIIQRTAAVGANIVGIAAALGVGKTTLARWLDEHPELRDALDKGRERERHKLHNQLFRQAMKGNVLASIFLLRARHGYQSEETHDARPALVINLPPALPSADYAKLVAREREAKVIEAETVK